MAVTVVTQKGYLSNISKVILFDFYSSSIGIEQGFNCDSPEGGTIKKKPALNKSAVKQNDDTTDNNKVAKQPKGVRFKDSFTTGNPFYYKLRFSRINLKKKS